MIQPGLTRVARLLADTPLSWRAIHVAGTNGKGSVCNYIAAMLDAYNNSTFQRISRRQWFSWGKFTSPHLVDPWDGIQINGNVIGKTEFELIERTVLKHNQKNAIGASEFEILTATAFKAFTAANVDIGIIEVGMGGEQDATNLLGTPMGVPESQLSKLKKYRAKPLVTAITRIGLDHQAFLGDNLVDIAKQKAGIMKLGVPVVFDTSNAPEAAAVIQARAAESGSTVQTLADIKQWQSGLDPAYLPQVELDLAAKTGADHAATTEKELQTSFAVANNTSVAIRCLYTALDQLTYIGSVSLSAHTDMAQEYSNLLAQWSSVSVTAYNPGRLQWTSTPSAIGEVQMLIDGAHNPQSAALLAEVLDKSSHKRPITWLLAASQGRNIEDSLSLLVKPGDSIFATEFGPVQGMPWVKPVPANDILVAARELMSGDTGKMVSYGNKVSEALEAAVEHAGNASLLVVTGSLYLVGDVHRLMNGR